MVVVRTREKTRKKVSDAMRVETLVILLCLVVFGGMIAFEFTDAGEQVRDNAAIANCRASKACVEAIRSR